MLTSNIAANDAQIKAMSMQNRVGCTMEKAKNNVKTNIASAAVGVSAGIAGAYALKKPNSKAVKFCSSLVDKAINSKVGEQAAEIVKKGVNVLKKNPAGAKTLAIIAIPAVLIGSAIASKQSYNNGKIQQKYEDRDYYTKMINN